MELGNGLEFVSNSKGQKIKSFLLKDIHHSLRRNPKNQLQVNIAEEPEYRTRDEFLTLTRKKSIFVIKKVSYI
ncbi:MAG: hypothetical protein QXO70_04330 [Candidatus Pacearchaeota archaeon]